MMANMLHLEDALDDTPQTKAMIDLFEKDTQTFKKFTKAISGSCQKICNAQVAMISANQELAYYLRLYGKQSSVETPNDSSLSTTLNQFAEYIDEISTCFQVFVTQINDAMIYPLTKTVETEFDELQTLNQMYQLSSEEHEQALQKYLRLPAKKEYEPQRKQFNEECYAFKKKFHQTSLNYFSSLNNLQIKRDYILIEPMLALMHGFKLFFKMGTETFSTGTSTIEGFLNKSSDHICEVKAKLSDEMNKNNQLIELLQNDDSIYYAEQESSGKITDSLQKNGYLNLRSKFPFIFKWDRGFYFLQNGWLMHQPKNEIVGTSFLELKSDLTVSSIEIDDRLFTFQIVSQFPKRVVYFQANNQRDMDEWILTLQNAINDDNRAKLLNYKNTTALQSAEQAQNSLSYSLEPNVNFELKESLKKSINNSQSIAKPQQGDIFKVRFLGSMNVKADKGNEYIHETIRSVMAARAKHNVFKLNELNLIVNSDSLSLFSVPSSTSPKVTDEERSIINPLSSEDLLKARFDLSDLAFWSYHQENQRLFGFIVKETNQTLKFLCLCFESDIDSTKICESIDKATLLAYQLLIDDNKAEHFKKMKQTEREILLHNIKSLPDSDDSENHDESHHESNDSGSHLYSIVEKSPNPNFVILDKDILETYKINLNSPTSDPNLPKSDSKLSETDA